MKSQPRKQDRNVNFKGTNPEIAKVKPSSLLAGDV